MGHKDNLTRAPPSKELEHSAAHPPCRSQLQVAEKESKQRVQRTKEQLSIGQVGKRNPKKEGLPTDPPSPFKGRPLGIPTLGRALP